MKKIFFSLAVACTLTIFACGGSAGHDHGDHPDGQTESNEASPHGEGKEYNSAYVCPMHCEGSGSDAPGQCPVCGMDYVAQTEHTGDGHHH